MMYCFLSGGSVLLLGSAMSLTAPKRIVQADADPVSLGFGVFHEAMLNYMI